ncbi:hypothetical protein [Pantoea agglomerans]|jgi:hypothetical protein|uniref:Uncharacterized protein n=1 Tax=Enterobacter agglomerans TaxID=549 RepID=A0ACC5PSP9_ENTAG|nr:hypothetical protein [Pantoea agglomerans]MBD8127983.1 hypothetical protein [Pantoea agglomerans]MBD8155747.1 hypothetical protein [Pantoea agglomerans]MBD8244891.1 hypothetical protein [Pantoea agglomerans]
MKRRLLIGLTGRILLIFIFTFLAMAALFGLASVFMAYDPDGHLIQKWLYDSRWAMFAWRLCIYVIIGCIWIMNMRPRLLKRWPEAAARLTRTELLAVIYVLATEYVAWSNAVQGG